MTRITSFLLLLLVPIVGSCAPSFENQCDSHNSVDEQVACLDTAFAELAITASEVSGEGDRERNGLRELIAFCEGLRERYGDEEWTAEYGDEYRERLAECTALWERLSADRDEGDEDEDRPIATRPAGEDEDPDGEASDEDPECPSEDEDPDGDETRRPDESERGEGPLDELDALHQQTRDSVQRSEESRERREMIRSGLRAGQGVVERLTGRTGDRSRGRDDGSRTR